MPEEKKVKVPRLGQAAKEFNVSNDRIIDILTKNGLEISAPTPNSKLTEEMYLCLQKELAKDKMVKEKSDQIIPPRIKKEETKPVASDKFPEEDKDSHILIHTNRLPEIQTVDSTIHTPEVKIIGSVPIESLTKPAKKKSSKGESKPVLWESSSSVGSLEEYGKIFEYVDKKIMNMAQSLMEGKIERRPVKGTEDACKNCDYKTVCGYEKGKSSTVVRKYSPKNALELMGYKVSEKETEEETK